MVDGVVGGEAGGVVEVEKTPTLRVGVDGNRAKGEAGTRMTKWTESAGVRVATRTACVAPVRHERRPKSGHTTGSFPTLRERSEPRDNVNSSATASSNTPSWPRAHQ